ncbi:MAG: NADH:flavin oxidoreductase [Alphaproteobacteria bacterium]|nr:NADH:flavin oxidoreductase [Alphaproteobacteria bacterium]
MAQPAFAPSAEPPRPSRDPLLQPLRIKGLLRRNRIMSTSHASTHDEEGLPGERYQRYHEEKAKGGLALTMFGGSSMVSPDSSWGGGQVDVSSDRVLPYLREFSERIHRHGAAIMCQISHLGRRADAMSWNWLPTLGPSRVRETRHRNFPREMDRGDIDRVIRDYAAAALRCKEGGLDGVETVTGGHLIGQFLSPRTNLRSDGFGGSPANRARFGLMVHEAIREAVGDDWLVGIRFVVDEDIEDGIGFDDCLELARLFEAAGHIDFFNCIFGRMDTDLALAEHNMPGMSQPLAPFLKPVGAFKRETRLPVFHAARIPDLATARHAIAENLLDMVAMTRAHMADPQIVNKLMRGEADRIRPCVGASYCMYKKTHCIHNPASGREQFLPQIVERAAAPGRKVVVIGGGPGGLEAARVSAERGHRVVLFEAGARLGGQLLTAVRATWRRDLIAIVDWRQAELDRLGVEVRLNRWAEADDVLAERPDAVIVATGGIPDTGWVEGAEHCISVWDVLADAGRAKDEIIVYDGTGRHEAVSCALHLAEQGRDVQFVTIDDNVALEMEYSARVVYRKRFAQNGVRTTLDHQLVRVHPAGNRLIATFRHELTREETELTATQVVVERGTLPVDDLYHALRDRSANRGVTDIDALLAGRPQLASPPTGGAFELHRIGDAVTSRNVHGAIYDALRLCSVM